MRSAIEREKKQARGIVIRHGAFAREPSAFWAYLWSEELLTDEALGITLTTPRIAQSRVASHESRDSRQDTVRQSDRPTVRPYQVLRELTQFQTLVVSRSRRGTS